MQAIGRVACAVGFIASVVALTGCATMKVDSFADRDFDQHQYRTYVWGADDDSTTGDARLDNNEFFRATIKANVDRALAGRGFVKAEGGQGDLVVHYHASITQEIDIREVDPDYDYCEDHDCSPYVYDAGTIFIDLVDPRTDRLVWRGWAEGSVDGIIDDQDLLDRRVAEAVDRIAERLPRAM